MYELKNPTVTKALSTIGANLRLNKMMLGIPVTLAGGVVVSYDRYFVTGALRFKGQLLVKKYHAEDGSLMVVINDAGVYGPLLVLKLVADRGEKPSRILTAGGVTINDVPTGRPYLIASWDKAGSGTDLWPLFEAMNPILEEAEDLEIGDLEARVVEATRSLA